MLVSENAHCFMELRKYSIEEAQEACYEDFVKNLELFAGKNVDEGICNISNYERFDNFCGKLIHYNNKNLQFKELISREMSTERYFNYMDRLKKSDQSSDDIPRIISMEETTKIEGETRLLEDVEVPTYINKDFKAIYPRYRIIFGVGEFPFLNFKIARIGNKEYFWYTITR